MKKQFLLTKTLLVALLCLVGQSVWADEANLTPTADTYFSWADGDTSYGTAETLYCGIWQEMWSDATPGLKMLNNVTANGKMAVFKFDVSSYKGKITSATFKVTATNPSSNTNTRSIYLGYFDLTSWDESSTANTSGMVTRSKTGLNIHPFNLSQAIAKGQTKEVSFSGDAFLTYLNNDADGIVSLIIYGVGQECSVNSKDATSGKPSLELTYTNETLYTATFTETNSLTPTITIYSDENRTVEVSNGTLASGTTYYYTATLAGYQDYKGSFTVATSNPVVNFTMTAKASVTTLRVNYKVGEDVVAYEDGDVSGLYVGESAAIPYRMYVTNGGKLYLANKQGGNPYYGKSTTLTANTIVEIPVTEVNLDGGTIELFKDLDGDVDDNASIRASFCGSYNNRAYTSSETLSPGIYKFIVKAQNKGRGSSVKVGNITIFGISDINASNNSWTDKTFTDVEIPVAGQLSIVKGALAIDCYDVIIAIRTADYTVPATLSSNGYATFASPYALDLTTANLPSGVTAYKASVSGTTVTFTALNQTVPANTGVLLKGTGTVNIPVAATGTAVEGNDFLVNNGGATFTGDASYYYFGLLKDSDPLTFRKFDPSTTAIPADKAYLKVSKSSVGDLARGLEFVFDDEVTGVNEVRSQKEDVRSEWFDLQGRKVAQPQKGLYIVNGRKVVVK